MPLLIALPLIPAHAAEAPPPAKNPTASASRFWLSLPCQSCRLNNDGERWRMPIGHVCAGTRRRNGRIVVLLMAAISSSTGRRCSGRDDAVSVVYYLFILLVFVLLLFICLLVDERITTR